MDMLFDMQTALLEFFSKKTTSKMENSPMHQYTSNNEKLEITQMLKEEHTKPGHTHLMGYRI